MSFGDMLDSGRYSRLESTTHSNEVKSITMALAHSLRQMETQFARIATQDFPDKVERVQSIKDDVHAHLMDAQSLMQNLSDEDRVLLTQELIPLQEEYDHLYSRYERERMRSTNARMAAAGAPQTQLGSAASTSYGVVLRSHDEYDTVAPPAVIATPSQGQLLLLEEEDRRRTEDVRLARLRDEQQVVLMGELEQLREMFVDLNFQVLRSRSHVQRIEETVNTIDATVTSGVDNVKKASLLQAASYTLAGMVVGMAVGGPVGAIAVGLKGMSVAAAVAVGGAAGAAAGAGAHTVRKTVINKQAEKLVRQEEEDQRKRDRFVEDVSRTLEDANCTSRETSIM